MPLKKFNILFFILPFSILYNDFCLVTERKSEVITCYIYKMKSLVCQFALLLIEKYDNITV